MSCPSGRGRGNRRASRPRQPDSRKSNSSHELGGRGRTRPGNRDSRRREFATGLLSRRSPFTPEEVSILEDVAPPSPRRYDARAPGPARASADRRGPQRRGRVSMRRGATEALAVPPARWSRASAACTRLAGDDLSSPRALPETCRLGPKGKHRLGRGSARPIDMAGKEGRLLPRDDVLRGFEGGIERHLRALARHFSSLVCLLRRPGRRARRTPCSPRSWPLGGSAGCGGREW